ncbi:zinc finger protein 568-like [Pogonomyrmex barbatus]|uniref:Zinc finger protein 568-like n=1 Tax=Pogonomyrmex barbatus TaxID=144034 RepID=A0A6I9W616_9HYME|nr:zinc finger protein 568-like [Pogonomyrmex barbatus]
METEMEKREEDRSYTIQIDNGMLTQANSDTSLCRVCLSMDHNNQCLFHKNWDDPDDADSLELSEKLQLCGGVEVLKDDGLPTSICLKCVINLNIAYDLREQCQKADMELRKLYGKVLYTNIASNCIPTKDQYCQTEFLDVIKSENNGKLNMDNKVNTEKDTIESNIIGHEEISDAFNQIKHPEDVLVDNEIDLDYSNKYKMEYDKIAKKDLYRTRRLAIFKRATSIENLKNHKERQRRYIKKSANVKRDNSDSEYQTKTRNVHSRVDRTSELKLQYKCQKCDRFYSSKKSLERHTSTHNKEFKCDSCDKQFLCLDKLLKHGNLHRTKEKPMPVLCRICNKNFRKTDTMVRHLNVHKKAYPKEVFSILKEIRDKRKLENNPESFEMSLLVATDEDEEMAHDGQLQSENDGTMRELRKRNTRVEQRDSDLVNSDSSNDKSEMFDDASLFHCKHCSKGYRTERSLQRHLLIHDEKKFVCNVCNMKFFRQDRLKSHMDRYGHDESKVCLEPQKPPDDKSAIKLINIWIREELDSDNEGKGFPCRICGKSYDTKKSLMKHQVNTHGKQDECCTTCGTVCNCDKDQEKSNEKSKLYTCEECNKSFEKEIKLQKHLRIHERTKEQQDVNFKRFLCHICSKTFRQNTGLMFHMRTHTGYKPHECRFCGRGFTSNSNCINHERTHTGDRPFVCQYCSAAFAKSCTLKAHITTHTGEANYHCKTCGKSFRRLKYLKEHRFTHTGEKPYACKICGTAYSHSGSLFVHEKKCKAQYNNYQSGVVQNAQQQHQQQQQQQQQQQISYSQSPQTTAGISVASTSSVITPIIATLPQAHLNVINSTLNVQANMDNVQRMNLHTANATTVVSSGLHPSVDISEMSSPVRNFSIIGHMFHT